MPRRNTVEIIINAEDRASRTISGVGDSIQGVGRIALAGIGIATAAVTAFGVSSVAAFSTFERGMNEIFTLLPGISGEAMDSMSAQVQQFSTRFGTLTDEVVPALYQALSAGVPQDNVFEFLETAQMAAIGGVTSLETAVDGITSVVNAYGSEVLSAAEASDLMFTAVRLGKTNFEELSRFMFQVIPTASSLGVEFGDVTAALASITAQGVPTRVAATQLRQMLVELSRAGGETATVFTELSGQSFADFIASGNNVQDALILMEQAAEQNGLSLADMFSSVEAGNAALALTGTGAENFSDNLAAMADSAGATETAFDTMNQGIAAVMDRLHATFQVLQQEIGARLAPAIEPILEGLVSILHIARLLVTGDFEGGIFGWAEDSPQMRAIFAFRRELVALFETVSAFFTHGGVVNLAAIFERLGMSFADSIELAQGIINAFNEIRRVVETIAEPFIRWFQENVKLEDILTALAVVIGSVVIPAIAGLVIAIAPVAAAIAGLVAAVTILRDIWESDWMGIRTSVENVVEWLVKTGVPGVLDFIESIIKWAQANPELTTTLLLLSGVVLAAGPIFTLLGTAVGFVTGALALLFSPAVLIAGAIAAIIAAANFGYPGGITQLLKDAATAAQQLAVIGFGILIGAANIVRNSIENLVQIVRDAVTALELLFQKIQEAPVDFLTGIFGGATGGIDLSGFQSGGYTGNAPGVAGVVHGREFVVPEQGALVVRGEGSGGATIENLIVQYNGIPQSQQEADSGVRYLVNALEAEGVSLS